MKLENRETFFMIEGEYDKKNRLLRSEVKLTVQEVRQIDSGELSLEDLERLVERKARVFKYRTQLTVHADFPREVGGYVNGYMFLTNNKNGSVGIRYGAIDEAKRCRLERYLIHEGFRYNKNSTSHAFELWKRFKTKDEANEYLAELRSFYDYDAMRKLIYGHIDIFGGEYWGCYYVALTITVNAIREANIPKFLTLMRCKSDAEIENIEAEAKRKHDERWAGLRREVEEKRLAREAANDCQDRATV